ncbi:carbonic anhydrase [Croceibacterium mercuriale]|uniref:carbonic anhydrase n=1 Tax=Croceibacterium mercuriale TaxID=1572751 RepID=A0A0B2BUT2_9SPHN|nr:carbonic anhydrase [Croceibacterium mercuriale]KHL25169.1 carbonic anhydrase [Croceibacterium mercuriale]
MEIGSGVARFQDQVHKQQQELFRTLARDGQSPKYLMISCADSRVVPELITQADPGDLFVCRNAGNIVPPFAVKNGGVSSTVEFGVMALGVTEIIVCGHSDCGAMKGMFNPAALEAMPNVKAWLAHAEPAFEVVKECYGHLDKDGQVAALTQENVAIQLVHLQNHPSVAAGLAAGRLQLHGWVFDIETGKIKALDHTGTFQDFHAGPDMPIAVPRREPKGSAAAAEAA